MYASLTSRLEVVSNLSDKLAFREQVGLLNSRTVQFIFYSSRKECRIIPASKGVRQLLMQHIKRCYEHVKAEENQTRICRVFSLARTKTKQIDVVRLS